MKSKEQKLILENVLSSGDLYARTAGILSGEYFDPEYRNAVNFIAEYNSKYGGMPDFELINAKFDLDLASQAGRITRDKFKFYCDEIEQFCKERAVTLAVSASLDDLEEGNHGAIMERLKKAMEVSLQKDMGVEMFGEDPELILRRMIENVIYYSTGIKGLDDYLGGGLARGQVTMFSANSGGGKSIMMSNLGVNYAVLHGLNVLYISLELSEDMIFLRNANIISGVDTKEWKEKIASIAAALNTAKKEGAGSFNVKRLVGGATANDIRAYIKQYELENGFLPDVLLVDYLDQMRPNGGTKNLQPYEQDKQKAEELYEVAVEINCICVTASQQNRDGIANAAPTQAIIAGGLTKINTVDNYVSIYMDPTMRIRGEMNVYFLKTRSSDGVGKTSQLHFDSTCLRITDGNGTHGATVAAIMKKKAQRKKSDQVEVEAATKKTDSVTNESVPLPGLENSDGTLNNPAVEDFIAKTEADLGVKILVSKATEEREVQDVTQLLKPKKVVAAKKSPLPEPEKVKTKAQITRELADLDPTALEVWNNAV